MDIREHNLLYISCCPRGSTADWEPDYLMIGTINNFSNIHSM